jgi:hypothetical protein
MPKEVSFLARPDYLLLQLRSKLDACSSQQLTEQEIDKCFDEIRPVITCGPVKAIKLAKNGEIDWDSYLFQPHQCNHF